MKVSPLKRVNVGLVAAASLVSDPLRAADGFERVRCDQPIVPALVGVRSTASEPVVRIEARRKSIRLEHLGAEIVDDSASTVFWRVCGRPFVVLDARNVWRDAIELPPHSREAPTFSTASCEVGGRKIGGIFLGVFSSRGTDGGSLWPVKAAWRVDLKLGKFVALDAAATCAPDGIYTADQAR